MRMACDVGGGLAYDGAYGPRVEMYVHPFGPARGVWFLTLSTCIYTVPALVMYASVLHAKVSTTKIDECVLIIKVPADRETWHISLFSPAFVLKHHFVLYGRSCLYPIYGIFL